MAATAGVVGGYGVQPTHKQLWHGLFGTNTAANVVVNGLTAQGSGTATARSGSVPNFSNVQVTSVSGGR